MSRSSGPRIVEGTCHEIFAYDIGHSINLDEAERLIKSGASRLSLTHRRRAPKHFNFTPTPVRIFQDSEPIEVPGARSLPGVELVLYDFGAISVSYRFPVEGTLEDLAILSEVLYDTEKLYGHSAAAVARVSELLAPAITKRGSSGFVENYSVFQIKGMAPAVPILELGDRYTVELAQILRSDRKAVSPDEVRDALSSKISYTRDDVTFIDWSAALVCDVEAEDVIAVLDFANVSLLEMRLLDGHLDQALETAYRIVGEQKKRASFFPGRGSLSFKEIGRLQVESAILYEDVHNALKLIGDQYLARVYRLASERFKLGDWNGSILRKLETLESIYQKFFDRQSNSRLEGLEWIIIILIAADIGIQFLPWLK